MRKNSSQKSSTGTDYASSWNFLTASEVAKTLAVLAGGFYCIRWVLTRIALTIAERTQAGAYDLDKLHSDCEVYAVIAAIPACVFAIVNTAACLDYQAVLRLLQRIEKAWLNTTETTRLRILALFVWLLSAGLYINALYPLTAAFTCLAIRLWVSERIDKSGIFATSYLFGILVISLYFLQAAA